MKITILILTLLITSQVFASKARMEALGQRNWGSLYIDNKRLTFVNPANLVDHNNYVVAELGDQNTSGSDAEATTNGEGGVFVKGKLFDYGVHLGNESNDAYLLRALTGVSSDVRPMLNRVDVFFAKDMGFKLGLGLWYASGKDKQTASGTELKQNSLGLKAGIVGKNYKVGIVQGISEKSENSAGGIGGGNAIEMKGKAMTMINAGYDLTDKITFFGEFIKIAGEVKGATGAVAGLNDELDLANHMVGVGYKIFNNDKINIYSDLTYRKFKMEWGSDTQTTTINTVLGVGGTSIDGALAASGLAVEMSYVPVNIAAEVKARDWLVFRGSIQQRLFGTDKNLAGEEITRKEGRVISVGAGLTFDNLTIDGLIQDRDNGQLGSRLTRVGATYYW